MSALVDRLRGIIAGTGAAPVRRAPAAGPEAHDSAAELLGGEWHPSGERSFLRVDRTYRPGHRHGRLTLVDCVLPEPGEWEHVLLGRDAAGEGGRGAAGGRTLFIDLETTGLAGGAGTYAFLVGCGWFEGATFRVRQLLLTSHTAERALLAEVASLAEACRLVVSYNGKTFDLPLIETRFLFNRMVPAFAEIPHLDMLHAARRLWRAGETGEAESAAGCGLSSVERTVCGHTRDGDVPGFEIPARYFHYVRTGDARPLEAVFEHNRLDLLSLAFLTARAVQLVEEGPVAVTTAREAVGLGRFFERAGHRTKARACFARACGLDGALPLPGDRSAIAEALRLYALLCRRERQYADAAAAWSRLLNMPGCPPALLREAAEALAIHHEHRLRDPGTARALAVRTLPLQGTPARLQAIHHRLARLDRKMAAPRAAALF